MTVARTKKTLKRQMGEAWRELQSSINKIGPGCAVRPRAATEAFVIDEDDDNTMKVTINPLACLLKEKASTSSNLFVTIDGKVNFSIDSPTQLLACHFKTNVGYFRQKKAREVDHVLGIHYDYDNRKPVHPVFHAQLTSFAERFTVINQQFNQGYTLGTDRMDQVARQVRLPTAHMDPIAVLLQLVADHLLNENSGAAEQQTFENLRKKLMFFRSDPRRSERLETAITEKCFRGPRWYPS